MLEPLESTDKIVQLKSVFKNDLKEITTKIYEFNDKIDEEKRRKENKTTRLPDFVDPNQKFQEPLILITKSTFASGAILELPLFPASLFVSIKCCSSFTNS